MRDNKTFTSRLEGVQGYSAKLGILQVAEQNLDELLQDFSDKTELPVRINLIKLTKDIDEAQVITKEVKRFLKTYAYDLPSFKSGSRSSSSSSSISLDDISVSVDDVDKQDKQASRKILEDDIANYIRAIDSHIAKLTFEPLNLSDPFQVNPFYKRIKIDSSDNMPMFLEGPASYIDPLPNGMKWSQVYPDVFSTYREVCALYEQVMIRFCEINGARYFLKENLHDRDYPENTRNRLIKFWSCASSTQQSLTTCINTLYDVDDTLVKLAEDSSKRGILNRFLTSNTTKNDILKELNACKVNLSKIEDLEKGIDNPYQPDYIDKAQNIISNYSNKSTQSRNLQDALGAPKKLSIPSPTSSSSRMTKGNRLAP